ncbi:MAG: helix-turn-helix domain-containing protein, partial [Alphaproteobacteria bacterium]
FFRLNVVPIRLPPLRERREDVPDLIRHFFTVVESEGLTVKQLAPEALALLKAHAWPGNVRELENLIRRLAALYPQETISGSVIEAELDDRSSTVAGMAADEGDIPLSRSVEIYLERYLESFAGALPPPGLYHRILREVEQPLISAALSSTKGNQIKAAELLGVNRNTLRKKIKELEITFLRGGA